MWTSSSHADLKKQYTNRMVLNYIECVVLSVVARPENNIQQQYLKTKDPKSKHFGANFV